MKKILFLVVILSAMSFPSFSQKHINKCGIEITGARPHVMLDKVVYYSVDIHNGSDKTVDEIHWEASFYNKFNDCIAKRKGSWSCGQFIKCIKPGDNRTDRETPSDVGDADKVKIEITKVHFEDGSSCN